MPTLSVCIHLQCHPSCIFLIIQVIFIVIFIISNIPKDKYNNIFKGAYERPEKYVSKNKTRKVKKNYL